MNISFVGKNPKSGIEPFNSPMVLAQPNSSPSEGFFFPMPTGEDEGDIAYWNPSAGPSGAWVKLASPTIASGEESKTLSHNGSTIFWDEASGGGLPNGKNKGDLIQWDPAAGEDGAWVVLEVEGASEENPKFLYWNGTSWNFVETKIFDVCENGQPKEYRIPAIEAV